MNSIDVIKIKAFDKAINNYHTNYDITEVVRIMLEAYINTLKATKDDIGVYNSISDNYFKDVKK